MAFSILTLVACVFVFGLGDLPAVAAIRCTFLSLAVFVLIHLYIILPVLLTLAPPSTRPRRVRVAQMFPANSTTLQPPPSPKLQQQPERRPVSSMHSLRRSHESLVSSKQFTGVPRVIVKDETSF